MCSLTLYSLTKDASGPNTWAGVALFVSPTYFATFPNASCKEKSKQKSKEKRERKTESENDRWRKKGRLIDNDRYICMQSVSWLLSYIRCSVVLNHSAFFPQREAATPQVQP